MHFGAFLFITGDVELEKVTHDALGSLDLDPLARIEQEGKVPCAPCLLHTHHCGSRNASSAVTHQSCLRSSQRRDHPIIRECGEEWREREWECGYEQLGHPSRGSLPHVDEQVRELQLAQRLPHKPALPVVFKPVELEGLGWGRHARSRKPRHAPPGPQQGRHPSRGQRALQEVGGGRSPAAILSTDRRHTGDRQETDRRGEAPGEGSYMVRMRRRAVWPIHSRVPK